MSTSLWGTKETQYFFELTQDRVLDAVEAAGLACTGRCMALASMENRVYEVELEAEESQTKSQRLYNKHSNSRIAKFYRPGRWSREQILEEHQFLIDLQENEIPAVAPLKFPDGETLKKLSDVDIHYALFPKVGGRAPQDLDNAGTQQLGRLLARLHGVGGASKATHRLSLTPTSYGRNNLKFLVDNQHIHAQVESEYRQLVERICDHIDPWFAETEMQRIHGDCHMGNILLGDMGFFLVDFDDMVVGPCVQDLWLILPGRDAVAIEQLETLLQAYEVMRHFDRRTLRLIEPLRALRFVHFSAWIAKRWSDPAFPAAFPQFSSDRYWFEQLADLREQWQLIQAMPE